jgi:LacI family transcriptional regulator
MKKPTIKDIARDTGVSTTTVINVLRGRESEVSSETAIRVRRRADELGYVRNLTAASLVSRRAHAIALIIVRGYCPASPIEQADVNPFYGELILRLEHEARQAGYMLNLFGGDEADYVDFILQRNVDAAVLVGITRPELPNTVARQGVPVLLVDTVPSAPPHLFVRTDEQRGGALAAEHLIRRGCRSVVFAGDTRQPPDTVPSLRLEGARRACAAHRVPLRESHHLTTYEDGRRAAPNIAKLKADGVVVAADILAAGLVHGLLDLGVRVPEDIAVVGYDNLLMARVIRPRLTTVDQGLGEKVSAIVDLIRNGAPGQGRVVQPTLVVRESA